MRRVSNSVFIYNIFISYDPLWKKNWSDRYNDTESSEKKYPQPESMLMKKEVRGTYDHRYENYNRIFIDKMMDCKV